MTRVEPIKFLFALPGFHLVERGAEIALLSIAAELAKAGDEVTVIGSGPMKEGTPYRYLRAPAIRRERFEGARTMPLLRDVTAFEEASFAPGLLRRYRPASYDATFTCSYPFTNWVLRRPSLSKRPRHIFITQNGDWPARSDDAEFRLFGCDGLVCTNPEYFEANRARWRARLIPNGVDVARFRAGRPDRVRFGIPADVPVVLMVSALIGSKRVDEGIRAIEGLKDVHLVCAGDGPLRVEIEALAARSLPDRFTRLVVNSSDMPALYRSADAFLHLSKDESFGNVYVEALASGLPIIAHDIPRVRWILGDGEHIVDTSDPTLVQGALQAALQEGAGRSAERMERAASFSWTAIAERYREFAVEVIENAPRHADDRKGV
jgi:glycosyltransferase involved in cell wall biosynthesis